MGSKTETPLGDRQIRKFIWAKPHQIDLRFPRGFTNEVAAEIQSILNTPLQPYAFTGKVVREGQSIGVADIHFRQIFELLYRSRCLRDLLWLLGEKRVGSYGELKKFVSGLPWAMILPPGISVAIKVRSLGSRLFHEKGIAEVIADCLRETGVSIRKSEAADTVLECNLEKNACRVLLSCYGKPGYRRNVKKSFVALAPLREELAACLFARQRSMFSSEISGKVLAVPFAGSGTLIIEGLLSLSGLAPGIFGREFAFEEFPCSPELSNAKVRERSRHSSKQALFPISVVAIERDEKQFAALTENLRAAWKIFGALDVIPPDLQLLKQEFETSVIAPGGGVFLPLNPPFGDRLDEDIPKLYRRLGDWTGKASRNSGTGFLLAAEKAAESAFSGKLPKHRGRSSPVIHGGKRISSYFFQIDG